MKFIKWIRLLNFVADIRRFVPYGILKSIICNIEGKLESHMAQNFMIKQNNMVKYCQEIGQNIIIK